MSRYLSQHKIYGSLLLIAGLMLALSLSSLLPAINLQGPVDDVLGWGMFLLTHSAGSKGFLVTLSVWLLFSVRLPLSRRQRVLKVLQLSLLLLIAFAAKQAIKPMVESPRPYTEYLASELLIPQADHFYRLSPMQKDQVILQVGEKISRWRTQHWQGEMDYSFPSGHTLFAAVCLAFFGGLFWKHQRYFTLALLGGWALGVGYSRLWLGMHRPQDLVGSLSILLLAWLCLPELKTLMSNKIERIYRIGRAKLSHHR